jgi:hypothetical protein
MSSSKMRNEKVYIQNKSELQFTNLEREDENFTNKKKYKRYIKYKNRITQCRDIPGGVFTKKVVKTECEAENKKLSFQYKYALLSYIYTKYKNRVLEKIENMNNEEDTSKIAMYINILADIFDIYIKDRKIDRNPFTARYLMDNMLSKDSEKIKYNEHCIKYIRSILEKEVYDGDYVKYIKKYTGCKDRLIKIITDINLPNT